MSESIFQKENDQLLYTILNERFFKPWSNSNSKLWQTAGMELYITNKCNQHCEYCYLYNNEKIYPSLGNNSTNIIHNLKIFLNWLLENNYSIPNIDLFSGEIWHTQLGRDCLQTILEYTLKGLKIDKINIPTNGTFILNDETLQPILNYRNWFADVNTILTFSLSIDGAIIDNINRPHNDNTTISEEQYDKIFSFSKETGCGFHPMVAACSIEYWKENFIWWKEQIKKYDFSTNVHSRVMMLEVRNNDWTKPKIQSYCDFISLLATDFFEEICNSNTELFSRFVLGDIEDLGEYSYLPWVFAENNLQLPCTIPYQLCIRLGDLAICPCHRTAHEKNLYGRFNVENDKITNITSQNFYLAGRILTANNLLCSIKCDTCKYGPYCIQGCLGAQIETHKDLLLPIDNVCNLLKAKTKTKLKLYEKFGCFDYFKILQPQDNVYLDAQKLLQFKETIENEK